MKHFISSMIFGFCIRYKFRFSPLMAEELIKTGSFTIEELEFSIFFSDFAYALENPVSFEELEKFADYCEEGGEMTLEEFHQENKSPEWSGIVILAKIPADLIAVELN